MWNSEWIRAVTRLLQGWKAIYQMALQSWSIVTTCAEPRKLVEAFIAHHLAIGAEHIFIFFDDPTDGMAVRFAKVPNVTTVACNDEYWMKRRPAGRPMDHRRRQSLNAQYAASVLCETDWIGHIDADEFLYPRKKNSMARLLSRVPEEIDAIRLLPAERMFVDVCEQGTLSYDGYFKLKPRHGSDWGQKLFGDLGTHFPHGFQGHEVGKSFMRRANRNAKFTVHLIKVDGRSIPEYKIPQREAVLLHLFPASFEDWCHKYERRVDNPSYFDAMPEKARLRYGLYSEVREAEGAMGIRRLFEKLCVIKQSSPVLAEHPKMFLRPTFEIEEAKKHLVVPFLQTRRFTHVSSPSKVPIAEHQRVFQIGMNRSGTREISALFGLRGFSYAHWDQGRLSKNLLAAKKSGDRPFAEYGCFQLLSDISHSNDHVGLHDGFYEFEFIASHFKSSIFLLNHRPVDDWLASRKRFRRGKYLAAAQSAHGLGSEEEVLDKWRHDWNNHIKRVRELAANKKIRLIEYSLYTEKPSVFFDRLAPFLDDAKYYGWTAS